MPEYASREEVFEFLQKWIYERGLNENYNYELCDTFEEIGLDMYDLVSLIIDLEEKYNVIMPNYRLEDKLIDILDDVRYRMFN